MGRFQHFMHNAVGCQCGKHVAKGMQTIKFGSEKNNSMVPVEKGPTIGKAFPCVKNWLFISPH